MRIDKKQGTQETEFMRNKPLAKECYRDARVALGRLGNCRNTKTSTDLVLTTGLDHICEGDIVEGVHGYRVSAADLPGVKSAHGKTIFKKNCELKVDGKLIPAMRKQNPKREWASFWVGKIDGVVRSFIVVPEGNTRSWLKRYDCCESEGVESID